MAARGAAARTAAARKRFMRTSAGVAVGVGGAALSTGCALGAVKATHPPEGGFAWWKRRTNKAGPAPEVAVRETAVFEVLEAVGVQREKLLAAACATWSGVELCAEAATARATADLESVVGAWRARGVLETMPRKPEPETRQTYATDVGSSAPAYLGREPAAPRLAAQGLADALECLRADGIAVIAGCVDTENVRKLRQQLRIIAGGGAFACPVEVSTADILAAAQGAAAPLTPTAGRRHFLLRGTELSESQLVPLLAPLMPLVYNYFAERRPDSLPGALLQANGMTKQGKEDAVADKLPNLFLSECQLLISDPGGVSQIWHRDNRQPGLTVILPLTDISTEIGPTHLLPGTHHLVDAGGAASACRSLCSSSGAVVAAPLAPGDALIYDARVLHRGLGNASYSRCRAVLVLRVDCSDTPPPGASVAQTALARLAGSMLQGLGIVYDALPVIGKKTD